MLGKGQRTDSHIFLEKDRRAGQRKLQEPCKQEGLGCHWLLAASYKAFISMDLRYRDTDSCPTAFDDKAVTANKENRDFEFSGMELFNAKVDINTLKILGVDIGVFGAASSRPSCRARLSWRGRRFLDNMEVGIPVLPLRLR